MYAALIRDWMPGVIPVDVIHDDFAAGTRISGFDGLISVVRSRDIRVNIIVQSLAQLSKQLDEGIEAYTVIDGPHGLHKQYTHYQQLISK